MNKYWYKNAVIYSLDVESFLDFNGDGIGDIKGLKHSLTYLSSLGVNCLWLLPFFCTPNRDNGYDVKDYYSVDPRSGNLGDFAELLEAAEELGIRILVDLVVNHTSDQHPWFQEARKDKDSKYRDYYIWVEEKPKNSDQKLIFGEQQKSNWAYDEEADAYYYHTFYEFQPDLNFTNPEVVKEIHQIMRFWLKLGVSGFRMDAVPHMIREKGNEQFEKDPFQLLEDLRAFVEEQRKDAVLLAEVDVEPDIYQDYFGDGDRIHMLLNFYLNNYLFLALARKEAGPVVDAIQKLPHCSEKAQMANFLRNHDELDLERLSKEEREEVYAAFAPQENMRIFGRGIRRRLAPMLGNDRKKMELIYSLMFSLPGTPVLRYGQEIGMGEDLSLEGRSSVRTLMQWSNQKNAGFSSVPPDKLVRPTISKGDYSYKHVNVNDQQRDPNSFLNWIKRAINFRKACPEFGRGTCQILDTKNPAVLAHYCQWESNLTLAIHNFSDQEVEITLDLKGVDSGGLIDLFGDQRYEALDLSSGKACLNGYGYRWFRSNKLQV